MTHKPWPWSTTSLWFGHITLWSTRYLYGCITFYSTIPKYLFIPCICYISITERKLRITCILVYLLLQITWFLYSCHMSAPMQFVLCSLYAPMHIRAHMALNSVDSSSQSQLFVIFYYYCTLMLIVIGCCSLLNLWLLPTESRPMIASKKSNLLLCFTILHYCSPAPNQVIFILMLILIAQFQYNPKTCFPYANILKVYAILFF